MEIVIVNNEEKVIKPYQIVNLEVPFSLYKDLQKDTFELRSNSNFGLISIKFSEIEFKEFLEETRRTHNE